LYNFDNTEIDTKKKIIGTLNRTQITYKYKIMDIQKCRLAQRYQGAHRNVD